MTADPTETLRALMLADSVGGACAYLNLPPGEQRGVTQSQLVLAGTAR